MVILLRFTFFFVDVGSHQFSVLVKALLVCLFRCLACYIPFLVRHRALAFNFPVILVNDVLGKLVGGGFFFKEVSSLMQTSKYFSLLLFFAIAVVGAL